MKKNMDKSSALVPGTRTQVNDEESPVFRFGLLVEEPQLLRMEEEESEIALVSDTVTQDADMSEPPTN